MAIAREALLRWIFGSEEARRYTQDSPILPDVWLAYGQRPGAAVDLLLTPHAESTAAALGAALAERLDAGAGSAVRLAYSESYVVASLTLTELIRGVLPLSGWWHRVWPARARNLGAWVETHGEELEGGLAPEDESHRHSRSRSALAWFVGLVGRIAAEEERTRDELGRVISLDYDYEAPDRAAILEAASQLLDGIGPPPKRLDPPLLWTVNRNRPARTALWRSTQAVKADAVSRLFDTSCADLRWAVIDSGVDARHPAFRRRAEDGELLPFAAQLTANTRVVASYDFTQLRGIIAGAPPAGQALPPELDQSELEQLEQRLRRGRAIDWDLLEPLLRVRYDSDYRPPVHEHGTHVAGILAGDWRVDDPQMPAEHDLIGVCADIEVYDLRVFDDDGHGDEFAITAALQFVRHLNAHSDLQVIHGVNLSLSLDHDVKNYAVGRTPVCAECERLIGSGVCVVTVAGNEGRSEFATDAGVTEGYRTVSITDPGNAQEVITVGATHRYEPHTYGVSYFSGRGPTGDGRQKPDLVAPGEKINAPVPGDDYKAKDGTSQAAPHVSGAAALLMARHEELRGQPRRLKEILCSSATDLGRERNFQGAGMLDVLRAMQSV